jgi:ubiquitin-like protein Pup
MAARENAEQKKATRREDDLDIEESQAAGATTEDKEALDEDVDAILDEIDGVLEENAEDFVKSFVQKGGQ